MNETHEKTDEDMSPRRSVICGLVYAVYAAAGIVWFVLLGAHSPWLLLSTGLCIGGAWAAFRSAVGEALTALRQALQVPGGYIVVKGEVTPEMLEQLKRDWAEMWSSTTDLPRDLGP